MSYDSERYLERRTNNKCQCGNDTKPSKSRCEICHAEHKYQTNNKRAKLREIGYCMCGQTKTSIGAHCQKCWFKSISYTATKSKENYGDLWIMLEKQGYKCGYTGVELIPGINASIDHIKPQALGGSNELENLIWCDLKINYMKRDMTIQDFILACSQIVATTGGNINYFNIVNNKYFSPRQLWLEFDD